MRGKQLFSMMTAATVVAFCLVTATASVGFSENRACIKPQQQGLATGATPAGRTWRVSAAVQPEAACESWLLRLDFTPSGTRKGSWSWGHQIKAGGHLPNGFGIAGEDEVSEVGRVFSGFVGGRIRTVAVTLSNGEHLTIHPKLPSLRQRKRLVWLRGLRSFVRFYPEGGRVKVVKLIDANGQVLEQKGARGF